MGTLSIIKEHKIVAILRGAKPNDVLKIADALYSGGIRVLEITLNSPDALSAIERTVNKVGKQMLIGAGTVLVEEDVTAAISSGAQFILSPIVDKKIIKLTKRYGAVSIPGALTPSEIWKAYRWGGDIIKVFPAQAGASYIKDIRGPLPQIPLMPTGGVKLDNIAAYHKAGAMGFGIGSALVDTAKEVDAQYLKELTEKAKKFIDAIALS